MGSRAGGERETFIKEDEEQTRPSTTLSTAATASARKQVGCVCAARGCMCELRNVLSHAPLVCLCVCVCSCVCLSHIHVAVVAMRGWSRHVAMRGCSQTVKAYPGFMRSPLGSRCARYARDPNICCLLALLERLERRVAAQPAADALRGLPLQPVPAQVQVHQRAVGQEHRRDRHETVEQRRKQMCGAISPGPPRNNAPLSADSVGHVEAARLVIPVHVVASYGGLR